MNPGTLKVPDDFFKIELPKKDTPPVSTKTTVAPVTKVPVTDTKNTEVVNPDDIPMTTADQREWDNMEMQRDVAFKIMYFFIVFIIATFGLLYTYFKMS